MQTSWNFEQQMVGPNHVVAFAFGPPSECEIEFRNMQFYSGGVETKEFVTDMERMQILSELI